MCKFFVKINKFNENIKLRYRRAMKHVYERVKLIIEPSSAVTLAVVLYSEDFQKRLRELADSKGKKELNVGIVFSGGRFLELCAARLHWCWGYAGLHLLHQAKHVLRAAKRQPET